MKSTETVSYTLTAKVLHWLIAIAIIGMLCLGWSFDYLPRNETKFALMQLHKSVGITILLLSLMRLVWRLLHRAPPLPADMPAWEKSAAHIGHFLLYFFMIAMPLSGWIMVSASAHNIPTILYGHFPWPSFPGVAGSPDREQIGRLMNDVHGYSGFILSVLVVGHIAAALKHHFMSKDDILLRMAPRGAHRFLNRLRGQS
jgi:cytochrome b561